MASLRTRLALLLGCWTAVSLGPAAGWFLLGPVDAGLAPTYLGLLVALFVAGVSLARVGVARVEDPALLLRDGLGLAGLMALSGVPLVGGILLTFVDVVTGATVAVGGAASFLAAFLVGFVADRAVLARRRGEDALGFRATKPPRSRSRRTLAAAGVVGGAVWAALELSAGDLTMAVVPGLLLIGQVPPLVRHWRTRSYAITDAGLVAWSGHLEWSNFDGVAVTDDRIELQGTVWPFGSLAWDRDSIANDEAVLAALESHLPRVEPDRERDEPSPLDNLRQAFGS